MQLQCFWSDIKRPKAAFNELVNHDLSSVMLLLRQMKWWDLCLENYRIQLGVFVGTAGVFTGMWGLRNIASFSTLGRKLGNFVENPLQSVTMGLVWSLQRVEGKGISNSGPKAAAQTSLCAVNPISCWQAPFGRGSFLCKKFQLEKGKKEPWSIFGDLGMRCSADNTSGK